VSGFGSSPIFVFDKTTWDVKPPGTFCGETFPVFAGDETRSPRILVTALRDIAGRSTQASHPFLMNTEAVAACFGRRDSISTRNDVDFVDTQHAIFRGKITNRQYPRWIHADLAPVCQPEPGRQRHRKENVLAERFWPVIKCEDIDQRGRDTPGKLRESLARYAKYYNSK
jgi:hypothetical protein